MPLALVQAIDSVQTHFHDLHLDVRSFLVFATRKGVWTAHVILQSAAPDSCRALLTHRESSK